MFKFLHVPKEFFCSVTELKLICLIYVCILLKMRILFTNLEWAYLKHRYGILDFLKKHNKTYVKL